MIYSTYMFMSQNAEDTEDRSANNDTVHALVIKLVLAK